MMLTTKPDPIEFFGKRRKDFPEKLIGKYSGELLIIGGGRCVWEDLRGFPIPDHVMCVNDIGMYWPGRIRHWYSNDITQLIHWSAARRTKYTEEWGRDWKLHSYSLRTEKPEYERIFRWPFPGNGSSGLVACYVGLALGYSEIILAGCPFDDTGHFFDPPQDHGLSFAPWSRFTNETREINLSRARELFQGRVRSLSGRL